jgi:hypothetical protein
MNTSRIISTLQKINLQLQRAQYCSAEQLRVLRKAKRKWQKKLDAIINPAAPPRPLPGKQAGLFGALVLAFMLSACNKSKIVEPETLGEVELVAVITTKRHNTVRVYKIKNTPCYVSVSRNNQSISCSQP